MEKYISPFIKLGPLPFSLKMRCVLMLALILANASAFAPGALHSSPVKLLLRHRGCSLCGSAARPAEAVLRQKPAKLAGDDAQGRATTRPAPLLPFAVLAWACLPLVAVAEGGGDEDKRVLYTSIYTLAHLPVIVPFLLFWKVDAQTKIKGAAVASPFFVGWIALLGGWLRF